MLIQGDDLIPLYCPVFFAQDDKEHKGELWGLANLLRFNPGKVETKDIVTRQAPGAPAVTGGTSGDRQQQQEQGREGLGTVGELAGLSAEEAALGKPVIFQMDALAIDDHHQQRRNPAVTAAAVGPGADDTDADEDGAADTGYAGYTGPSDEMEIEGVRDGGGVGEEGEGAEGKGGKKNRKRTKVRKGVGGVMNNLPKGVEEEDQGLGELALELLAHEQQEQQEVEEEGWEEEGVGGEEEELNSSDEEKALQMGEPQQQRRQERKQQRRKRQQVVDSSEEEEEEGGEVGQGGRVAMVAAPGEVAAGGGGVAPSLATDLMLCELKEEGLVLHMHRHDQVGRGEGLEMCVGLRGGGAIRGFSNG